MHFISKSLFAFFFLFVKIDMGTILFSHNSIFYFQSFTFFLMIWSVVVSQSVRVCSVVKERLPERGMETVLGN